MSHTFNNTALFIKRAEEYQTVDYIIKAFESNNIGKVHDVKFIKKHNEHGSNYNGVIIIFKRWNMNSLVQKLLQEMSNSPNGTTKFYYNQSRYWIINIHRQHIPECQENTSVDSSLPDKERICQLEELVKSMAVQIHYYQTKQEKTERLIMDLEQNETRHHLVNVELQLQLDESVIKQQLSDDVLREEIKKLREDNEMLRCKVALNAIDMVRQDIKIQNLQEEVNETTCIMSYIETQVSDMKKMLESVLDTDPIKPIINTYINEYLR